jgi:hypothetical protein
MNALMSGYFRRRARRTVNPTICIVYYNTRYIIQYTLYIVCTHMMSRAVLASTGDPRGRARRPSVRRDRRGAERPARTVRQALTAKDIDKCPGRL